ncbi:MAG: T9SS type A sorting domain-containing protein [Bacteroidetes bacterium]|nr:T9SS type A sorting domain-containing protein [Bacteroidota bacterium]
MKKIYLILMIILFTSVPKLFAQWEKVADYNVGVGLMAVHGSTVFLYGYQGQQYVFRSTDNGSTWTNIANKFPDKVYYVHGHGNEVFAIVGINRIYSSSDDGVTWVSKSTISFSGGAVLSLVSDGNTLYALSNRNAVFKSEDNGSSWNQININYTQAQVLGFDFAASGNKMVFCAVNLGSFISTDGGANWTLKNPKIIIGSVHTVNGEIYGSTYGMYKFVADTGWASITSGFPSGIGVTAGTRSTVSVGNKIFTYYSDIIFQAGKVFTSEDNGNNWSEVGNNFPPALASSLNDFLAATPQYLYFYNSNSASVYRYPIQGTTSIENNNVIIPQEFSLSQNYPNPFNPSTKISFSLPSSTNVSLKVFNTLGQEVSELVNENLQPGKYSVDFDASKLSSGVYFYTLRANDFVQSKKMILMK